MRRQKKQNPKSNLAGITFTQRTERVEVKPETDYYDQRWGQDPFFKTFEIQIPDTSNYPEQQELVQLDNYVLSAISWHGQGFEEAVVLINDGILRIGDEIDGLRLETILSNSVILIKNGRRYILNIKGTS